MNFHDVNLPKYIEIFAVGISEFTTSCVTSMSGREARSSDSKIARRRYLLKGCRLSQLQFDAFNSFFIARAGKRFSFRLKDYFDFTVDKQLIATGDDIETKFQLKKLYHDDFAPYLRNITKPKINTLKLWLNNEEIVPQHIDPLQVLYNFPRQFQLTGSWSLVLNLMYWYDLLMIISSIVLIKMEQ